MSASKSPKSKLPVPTTPPRPPARQKPDKAPPAHSGPVAAMMRGVIDRIGEMARTLGPYEAFVTVLTITGMVGLHYVTDPWPVVSLVALGVTAPLVAKFVQRERP